MKFDYEYYTLKNGTRVFLMPTSTVNSATISAFIKSGSSKETDDMQGITHFVEHVALTATKTWQTKEELNEISEFTGARYNGSTSRELLNYYINVPYTSVPFGIKFIYEVLYKCTLDEKYIEQERNIILDEITKQEDSILHQIRMFAANALNTQNSGYVRSIAGDSDHIKKFSADQVRDFYKKAHSPNKVFISIVGNFDTKVAKDIIKDLFETENEVEKLTDYPLEGIKSNIVKAKSSPKTQLIITGLVFPGLNARELDEVQSNYLDMALSILAGPMSSRLMHRLREKENLLYSIYADSTNLETHGFTNVNYDIPPEFFSKTLKITLEELEEYFTKGPTEKELTHYKEYIANRQLINYDHVFSYAGLIRSALLWDMKVVDLDEKIKVIREASLNDLNQMIKKNVDLNKINCITFGNISDKTEADVKGILKKYV